MNRNLEEVLVESLNLEGFLTINKIFKDGTRECVFKDKQNLIVNGAKQILLSQIYYSSISHGSPLSYAKVGIGGATDVAGLFPKVPVSGMTDLYTPSLVVPISKTGENLTTPSITLMVNVDNSIGNGLKINEAGFFSSSNIMFNIKTFPFVLKDPSFSLNLEWVIRA